MGEWGAGQEMDRGTLEREMRGMRALQARDVREGLGTSGAQG